MFKLNLRLMMHNDSLFIGLVAPISSEGCVFTCHQEDGAQRRDLWVPGFLFLGVGARPGTLMRCSCCPGLDLLPIPRRGQHGTGAEPPSVSGRAVRDKDLANSPPPFLSDYQRLVRWRSIKPWP